MHPQGVSSDRLRISSSLLPPVNHFCQAARVSSPFPRRLRFRLHSDHPTHEVRGLFPHSLSAPRLTSCLIGDRARGVRGLCCCETLRSSIYAPHDGAHPLVKRNSPNHSHASRTGFLSIKEPSYPDRTLPLHSSPTHILEWPGPREAPHCR